jgi:hypothetical protein
VLHDVMSVYDAVVSSAESAAAGKDITWDQVLPYTFVYYSALSTLY